MKSMHHEIAIALEHKYAPEQRKVQLTGTQALFFDAEVCSDKQMERVQIEHEWPRSTYRSFYA